MDECFHWTDLSRSKELCATLSDSRNNWLLSIWSPVCTLSMLFQRRDLSATVARHLPTTPAPATWRGSLSLRSLGCSSPRPRGCLLGSTWVGTWRSRQWAFLQGLCRQSVWGKSKTVSLHIINQYFSPYLQFNFPSNLLFLYWKVYSVCQIGWQQTPVLWQRVTTKLSCYFLTCCDLNCPVVSRNIVPRLS